MEMVIFYSHLTFFLLMQSYLWDNDKVVAEWVEEQMQGCGMREENTSYLQENLQIMRRDAAISQVKEVVKVRPPCSVVVFA